MQQICAYYECHKCFSLYPGAKISELLEKPDETIGYSGPAFWICPLCGVDNVAEKSMVNIKYKKAAIKDISVNIGVALNKRIAKDVIAAAKEMIKRGEENG